MSLAIHTEVEIMIWVAHSRGTAITIDLPPRYLGYGLYQSRSSSKIRPFRGMTIPDTVAGSQFWTAHLISVTNRPNEDRERYYGCLMSPPNIIESLPSLTSAVTEFGSMSIQLADPAIRPFFAVDLSKISVQNFINVYRVICNRRYLVWRGYLDGVNIDSSHITTIQARSITKRFDRQATFGFDDEIPKWIDNDFKIPIVAARLIPYSVQVQDHSVVGCEPFSDSFYDSISRPRYRDYSDTTGQFYLDSGNVMVVDYDYGRQTMGAGALSYFRSLINQQRFNITDAGRARVTSAIDRILTHYAGHIEHRRPQYVSFVPADVVPTRISMSTSGRMTFDRGIFFAPSENNDVSSLFDPNSSNYVLSDLPNTHISPGEVDNEVSAAHFERYLMGSEWFSVDIDGDLSGDQEVYPLRSKSAMFAAVEPVTTDVDNLKMRFEQGYTGFDQTSAFPSLALGDSYANWTVLGVETGCRVVHDHPSSGRFSRPQVSERVHPLDSFYRWTLQSDKSGSTSTSPYLRASIYTPHAVGLTYYISRRSDLGPISTINRLFNAGVGFDNRPRAYGAIYLTAAPDASLTILGAFWDDIVSGFQLNQWSIDNRYAFVRWMTFSTIKGGLLGKRAHIKEAAKYLHLVEHRESRRNTDEDHYRLGIYTGGSSTRSTWLSNGEIAVAMARSKDMYATTQQIDRHIKIPQGRLASIQGTSYEVDAKHQSGSTSNLRVMPALPASSILDHDYPAIQTNRSPYGGGAYYISATYGLLDEVGYWDSSILNNKAAASDLGEGRYFKGHYHHDQSGAGQGVAPANFIKAVIQGAGFGTSIGFSSSTYSELTSTNPMQLISDSDSSYRALLERLLPALGKFIRFNPYDNEIELIDWSRSAPLFPFDGAAPRAPIAFFDEDCMIYRGSSHLAASRATAFIYENADMLRGTNTLDNFDDDHFRQAKYASFHATPFAQGKTVTVQTGTWWENASRGIHFYDRLASTLSQRIDIVSFFVPIDVLLGVGSPDYVSVGKWVRIANSAIANCIADVLIMETSASESGTEFRAYRFADTMAPYPGVSEHRNPTIKDKIDNRIPLPTIPTEDTLPEPSAIVVTEFNESGTSFNIGGFIVPRDIGDNPDLPIMTVMSVGEGSGDGGNAMLRAPTPMIDRDLLPDVLVPAGIAKDDSAIYILDRGNSTDRRVKIHKYDHEWNRQSSRPIVVTLSEYGYYGMDIYDGRLYIIKNFGTIITYNASTLHIQEYVKSSGGRNDKPISISVHEGKVYVLDEDKIIYIYSLNNETNSATLVDTISLADDSTFSNIFVDDNYIYVVRTSFTSDGVFYGRDVVRFYELDGTPINREVVLNRTDRHHDFYVEADRFYTIGGRQLTNFTDNFGNSLPQTTICPVFAYDLLGNVTIFDDDYKFTLFTHDANASSQSILSSIDADEENIYALTQKNTDPVQAIILTYRPNGMQRVGTDKTLIPHVVLLDFDIQGDVIYVGSTGRRIYRYSDTGTRLSSSIRTVSQNSAIWGVAVTDDRVYALSKYQKQLAIFTYDLSGASQRDEWIITSTDEAFYRREYYGLSVADDKVYTIEESNLRIVVYNLDGERIEQYDLAGDHLAPRSIAVVGNTAYVTNHKDNGDDTTTFEIFTYNLARSGRR